MNTLILDSLPPDTHAAKGRAPSSRAIIGVSVFLTDVVHALLRFGSYDRFCFRRGHVPWDGDSRLELAYAGDRVHILGSDNVHELVGFDQSVLASGGPDLLEHQILRRACAPKRDWPITGIIHSVFSAYRPQWTLPLLLGDVCPWDALICSSRAGRTAIEHYLATLRETYAPTTAIEDFPSVQLPVIPLGTDAIDEDPDRRAVVRERLGLTADDVLVLYVGRFSPTAKCDLVPVIAAFAGIRTPRRGHVQLALAGDDTRHHMADALRDIASQLGCGERVSVHANLTHAEKLDLYLAGDVFVAPSDHLQETFGLTVVEALAAGLPVVASDWDGYRELVVEAETGFLVPTSWTELGPLFDAMHLCGSPEFDGVLSGATIVDVDALRLSMETLAHDHERRATMSRNARRWFFENVHWPVVIRRFEELWSELKAQARRDAGAYRHVSTVGSSVGRSFGHYPSERLSDECVVTLSRTSDADALIAASMLTPTAQIPRFEELAQWIRWELRTTAETSIGALVSKACAAGTANDLTIRLAIARLLKYGVVRAAAPREQPLASMSMSRSVEEGI